MSPVFALPGTAESMKMEITQQTVTVSGVVKDKKGEYFVHGFTLAITAQNPFYRPVARHNGAGIRQCIQNKVSICHQSQP